MDDETPELGISILGEFRGEGIGTALIPDFEGLELLESLKRRSL